jgi:tRNA A-37 threonylcarbamoyl transferase component Bud32
VTTAGLPYQIENAIQFSNGGGVYLARDTRSDTRVVLKEGRPHAGLDAAGRDAVTRLSHERHMLERLAGLDAVPALIDYFILGDHHFLVEEFIDGSPLQRLLVSRYPLTRPDRAEDDLAEYTEWALGMLTRVERAIESVHERGVVFGDLHPSNVLVSVDDRLVLIDFEVSTLAEQQTRSALAHPGFQPPVDRTGAAADDYALACMHLGMFAPQTTILLPLHEAKAAQLADTIGEAFPVPRETTRRALETITARPGSIGPDETMHELPMPGRAAWPAVRDALRRAILASSTPERDDRLFPGDVAQFQPGGGVNLAHGTAGVLYALAETGAEPLPEHGDWLRRHAPVSELGAGFYDGRHGIAYVLERLGYRQDALDLIAARADQVDSLELGLHSGLAGIGLNLLHFARLTGEPSCAERAEHVVDIVASRLGGPEDVPPTSGGNNPQAGLLYGSSGPALLFLHAYERSGDAALLDLAEVALGQDLRRCVRTADGTLQVNQGWRTLPYLDEGSAGIALVLARYLAHRPDSELASALDELVAVTRAGYFVQSGLFTGRAGIIATAGMLSRVADSPGLIRGLSWHAVPYADGLAFPGDELLRLSMDFATGTAGVLFSIGTAQDDRPAVLPFFESLAGAGSTATRITTGGHESYEPGEEV